jgi:hypothetical protein
VREYRDRELLGTDDPANPLGGVVGGLLIAVLGAG